MTTADTRKREVEDASVFLPTGAYVNTPEQRAAAARLIVRVGGADRDGVARVLDVLGLTP